MVEEVIHMIAANKRKEDALGSKFNFGTANESHLQVYEVWIALNDSL